MVESTLSYNRIHALSIGLADAGTPEFENAMRFEGFWWHDRMVIRRNILGELEYAWWAFGVPPVL